MGVKCVSEAVSEYYCSFTIPSQCKIIHYRVGVVGSYKITNFRSRNKLIESQVSFYFVQFFIYFFGGENWIAIQKLQNEKCKRLRTSNIVVNHFSVRPFWSDIVHLLLHPLFEGCLMG